MEDIIYIFPNIGNQIDVYKMKTKITEQDYIKANRKASREEELKLYGRQISNRKTVHKSKKNV